MLGFFKPHIIPSSSVPYNILFHEHTIIYLSIISGSFRLFGYYKADPLIFKFIINQLIFQMKKLRTEITMISVPLR